MKNFRLLFYFFLLFVKISYGQVQLEWNVIHVPLNNQQNFCSTERDQLKIASNGHIVVGYRFNIDSIGSTLGIASYDQAGGFNWERYYYGSFASGSVFKSIELDSADNVYLMGVVNFQTFVEDNAIIKYDINGNQLWLVEDDSIETGGESTLLIGDRYYMQSRFHPSLYRYDLNGIKLDTIAIDTFSLGIAVSAQPRIVHSGNDIYYGSLLDKLNPYSGMLYAAKAINADSIIWKKVIDADTTPERVIDIVPDHGGNLYMTALGNSTQPNNTFMFTCAFDSNTGDTLWTAQVHTQPGFPAYPSDIDTDNSGHIYVSGTIYNTVNSRAEAALIQYDALTGQENWVIKMDSAHLYWVDIVKISIDTLTKDVYFAYYVIPSGGNYITCIAKIDSSGNVIWRHLFNNVSAPDAFLYDQSGQIFLASGAYISKFSLTTGINEQYPNAGSISLIPNPAGESFVVRTYNTSISGKISVTDITGRTIKNDVDINTNIDCNQWKPGIYFINVFFGDSFAKALKLIKI